MGKLIKKKKKKKFFKKKKKKKKRQKAGVSEEGTEDQLQKSTN